MKSRWPAIGGGVFAGVDFMIAYMDTDLSTSECDDACGQVLFTVSHAF